MTNTALFLSMLRAYDGKAFTHDYIFGFTYKHNVYSVHATADILPVILCLDKASRGAGYALRFCPNKDIKVALMSMGAKLLCSEAYFDEMVANSIYNKGEIFEKLITESFGQVWVKDNIPYTEAGDIEVNGKAYQIKFQKATFCNERASQV